jgi:site-specific DNA-methyltransferase (adenine-specific)
MTGSGMAPTDEFDGVRLFQADALDVLSSMGDGCVDAVVTDPPYGLGFDYGAYADSRENLRALVERFMPEARRVARRVVVAPGQTQVCLYPPPDWMLAVTWDTTGTFGKYGYSQWMPVLVYGDDLKGFGNVNGVTKSDRLHITGGSGVGFMRSKERNDHPCPKPVNVMKLLVRRLTTPGEAVLDPFMGSGTTGVAAVISGRSFVGVEQHPPYYATAAERLRAADGQGSLFDAARTHSGGPEAGG